MSIKRLRELLTTPVAEADLNARALPLLAPGVFWWFFLSLLFAAICGVLGLKQALHGEYVVQDDARQHVFWMARFLDPDLFPRDLIADFFQSVAPHGYTALYRLMAEFGLDPLLFNKLLPVGLGLIVTGYCFGLALQILPVPLSGFLAALLLNQNLWMKNDLASGTPRAFVYPLFLAFLYYLSRRSLIPCLAALALQGLFYPQIVLVSAGMLILRLSRCEQGRIRFSRDRVDYLFCLIGLGVALLALSPFALQASGFGPTITADQARALPEFCRSGRVPFFSSRPWKYWVTGFRSGILPQPEALFNPKVLLIGLLLPILLRSPSRSGLAKQVTRSIDLLPQILLASAGMFLAAHALLFRLHLPSRYTKYTFRIVLALAAGVALVLILDAILQWAEKNPRFLRWFVASAFIAFSGALLLWSPLSAKKFPSNLSYRTGKHPDLYQFFSRQPKGILIASLTEQVNQLPTFSRRSILVGREYAIPYQIGYYRQFRQRTADLVRAQYSPDLAVVQGFIRKYGVSLWLLERTSFTPEYVSRDTWIKQYQPEANEAVHRLKKGEVPALAAFMDRCSVYEDMHFVVLDARCILQARRAEKTRSKGPLPGRENRRPPRLAFPLTPLLTTETVVS